MKLMKSLKKKAMILGVMVAAALTFGVMAEASNITDTKTAPKMIGYGQTWDTVINGNVSKNYIHTGISAYQYQGNSLQLNTLCFDTYYIGNNSASTQGPTVKSLQIQVGANVDGVNKTATLNFTDTDTKYKVDVTGGSNYALVAMNSNQWNSYAGYENYKDYAGGYFFIQGTGDSTVSTVVDANGQSIIRINTTEYVAGDNVTIEKNEAGQKVITAQGTTNQSMVVEGEDTKTITITDSANKTITANFTDNDTKISSVEVTTNENGKQALTITDSANQSFTAELPTYEAGEGIKIEDGKISVDFKDNDTTYTAGQGVTISADNQISANLKEGEGIKLTNNDDGSITISANVTSGIQASEVVADWDESDKHSIKIQIASTDSQGVASVSDGQVIEGIALASEVGDLASTDYVNYFGDNYSLVNAVEDTMTEAQKHSIVSEGNNIVVDVEENDGVKNFTVSLKEDIEVKSVTADNVTAKAVNVGNVNINEAGINAGNTQIKNVADATEDNDAVNLGQLNKAKEEAAQGISEAKQDAAQAMQGVNAANQRIDKLSTRVNKGIAGAAALAALHPMDFDPEDKLTFAAGYGHYKGESAVALGAFYRPDEKVMFSIGGTLGNDNNMVNAGVSFSLDRNNRVTGSRTAMAREITELKAQNAERDNQIADLKAQLASLTELVSKMSK
ncbi:MAG: YadA-like family protein [Phascolarctobacterium sp.]|nr:YadA-like family protein [Phascolarctobacterium sp.]